MRFLIVGMGSIGRQHYQNLHSLGYRDITFLRKGRRNDAEQKKFIREYNPCIFYSPREAYNSKPDAVFIATPTSLHVPGAMRALWSDAHVFIEKPISHTLSGVKELLALAKKKKKIVYVGYHFRHHPQLKIIKKLLDKKILGEIIYANLIHGEYLPDFHPWEDYKKGYAARIDLGGGVLLTQCHDLDNAVWFFGKLKLKAAHIKNTKTLGIDVEDTADLMFTSANNNLISLHVDYLLRPAKKHYAIYGTRGTLEWDYRKSELVFTSSKGQRVLYPLSKSGLDFRIISKKAKTLEIQDFVQCIKKHKQPTTNGALAAEELKLILEAKKMSWKFV